MKIKPFILNGVGAYKHYLSYKRPVEKQVIEDICNFIKIIKYHLFDTKDIIIMKKSKFCIDCNC